MSVPAQILVVGESVLDRVRLADGAVRETPGGSTANVAVGLARLGHRTRFLTQLGNDQAGALMRAHLSTAGVAVEAQPTPTGRTSTAEAVLDEQGAATYTFDLDFALGTEADLGTATHLHLGSVSAILGDGWTRMRDLAVGARGSIRVSYDVNLRPALTGADDDVRRRVLALAAAADLVKASDEDLAALWPELSPSEAAAQLIAAGAGVAVVTLGAQGSLLHRADGLALVHPARTADVVDTIGAGDSFMSGLIDSLAGHDWDSLAADDWARTLDHAAACAAYTVSHAGAVMPTRPDLR